MSLFSPSAWIARVLRIAGIVLLVIGVCPNYVDESHGSMRSERWRVGMDASPLFRYDRSTTKEVDAAGTESETSQWVYEVGFLSWSMAAFVASVVLLAAARVLRKAASKPSGDEAPGARGA